MENRRKKIKKEIKINKNKNKIFFYNNLVNYYKKFESNIFFKVNKKQ